MSDWVKVDNKLVNLATGVYITQSLQVTTHAIPEDQERQVVSLFAPADRSFNGLTLWWGEPGVWDSDNTKLAELAERLGAIPLWQEDEHG